MNKLHSVLVKLFMVAYILLNGDFKIFSEFGGSAQLFIFKVELCTNVQSKPLSPAFGNTLLGGVFIYLNL